MALCPVGSRSEDEVMTVIRHPATPETYRPSPAPEPNVIAMTEASLVPVRRDGRTVGAYVLSNGTVRFRPALDVGEVVSATAAVAAIVAIAAAVATARRRVPSVGAVTMGPGGWVSVKGAPASLLSGRRPWWARLLGARRLVVEH
jgi:hypothetical protein